MINASELGVAPFFHFVHIAVDNPISLATPLGDLPLLKAGEKELVSSYKKDNNSYLRESGIRADCENLVTQNITRPVNFNDASIYAYAIKVWDSKQLRVKYTDFPVEFRTQKPLCHSLRMDPKQIHLFLYIF